jgi:general secretion pathway protein D
VPGLGDLPLLGRLFSTRQTDKQKTEIVLSITPHLVRSLKRPDARASEFWSGSETILRASPQALQRPKTPASTVNAVKPSVQPDPVSTTQAPTVKENKAEAPEVNPTESPTAISLAWQGPKQVKPGEQFQVTLMLKADGGLRSLPFQLGYNPAALKVVDVVEGEFFKQNGVQTSFPNTVDIEAGKIFVGVVRAGTEGAAGENSLATITFKALTPQAKTEVKLLAATPIGVGDKSPRPDMPDAYAVTIGD